MNELNDDKSKMKINDKVLLILSAIGLLFCLLAFWFFLDKLKIIEEWQFYIFTSISYVFVFIYGVNKQIVLKKKVTKFVSLLLLIFFAVFPIFVGFIIFYFKFLPFPKGFLTYIIIGFILLPISALCFDKSLKFFEGKKRSKAEHGS